MDLSYSSSFAVGVADIKVFSAPQVQVEYSPSCLICSLNITDYDYGTVDSHDENEKKKNEICQRFSTLICRYLNINSEQFKLYQEKTLNDGDFNNIPNREEFDVDIKYKVETETKIKICNGCLQEADNFCRIYGEWHALKLKLNWCLKRITELMNETVISEDDCEKKICKFREEILHSAQKKINVFPDFELRLTRTKTTTKKKKRNIKSKSRKGRKRKLPSSKIKSEPCPDTDSYVKAEPHSPEDDECNSFEPIDDPPFEDIDAVTANDEDKVENKTCKKESRKRKQKQKRTKEKKRYICHICGRNFYSNFTLKDHHTVFHQESINFFKCDICPKEFATQENLRRHQKCSHGTREFVCDICGKAFGLQTMLRRHMNSHSEMKRFKCEVCGMAFGHRYHLKRHETTHTDEKKMKCGICGERFRQWTACKSHLKKAHDIHETEEGHIINEGITRVQNRSRWSKTKRTVTDATAVSVNEQAGPKTICQEDESETRQSEIQTKNQDEGEIAIGPTAASSSALVIKM